MMENEKLNVRIIGLGIPFKINFTNDKEFLKNQLNNIKDEYSDVIYPSDLEYAGENIVDETINKESVKKRVILIAVPHKGFADFSSVEKLYLKNDIQLDVITLGGEMKCDELIELCDKTGGHMYTIEDMGELSRLYYDIYFNNNINTTDSDGDKLYDVVERNGIRLKNGKVIYTDPYEADTDGDGLLDGEEIIPEIVFTPISLTLKKSSYRFYYNWKSDPTNPDSDGDGWSDKEDNRPLDKGIYSESAGGIVVGELTIVSSLYNFCLAGHSYLVYKSYINDTLDFSGLSGGYKLLNNNTEYVEVEAGLYDICRWESVSLGNTMKSIDGNFELIEYHVDSDDVGIFYNREFALEVDEFYRILSTEPLYNKNRAYTQQITNAQLENCINEHKRLDYYDILWNNCVDVAGKSWKAAFGTDEFIVSNVPLYLYTAIMRKNGNYEFDNWKALGYR